MDRAVLTDESLAAYHEQPLVVVEEEGPQSGRTMVYQEGPLIRVAVDSDRHHFETFFLEALNGR